jgi:hypothetical protein
MGKQFIKYTFGAAALYILVAHASGTGALIINGANGFARADRAVQGR